MNTYIYAFRWGKTGPELDLFYKLQTDVKSAKEAKLLLTILPSAKELLNEDTRTIFSAQLRCRCNAMKLKAVYYENELTAENWEYFLKHEYKNNPDSRFLN